MKNTVLLMTILWFMVGCTQSRIQYTIPDRSVGIAKYRKNFSQIGVEKVLLPAYLEESKIAVEIEPGVFEYRDALWAVPLRKRVTSMLIAHLQKSFSTPEVYGYPWGVSRSGGLHLKVNINRFIYSQGMVVLEANYRVRRVPSGKSVGRLFSVSVPSAGDIRSIINGMGKAYGALMEKISLDISRSY